MRCQKCQKLLRLKHQVIEVDTLVKFYECKNGHETTYKRFGKSYTINDKVFYVDSEYIPPTRIPTI